MDNNFRKGTNMKKGDTVEVSIAGQVAGTAVIESIADGKATLLIPMQRVVMGVRTELAPNPVSTATNETVVLGTENTDVSTPSAPLAAPAEPISTVTTGEIKADAVVESKVEQGGEAPGSPSVPAAQTQAVEGTSDNTEGS